MSLKRFNWQLVYFKSRNTIDCSKSRNKHEHTKFAEAREYFFLQIIEIDEPIWWQAHMEYFMALAWAWKHCSFTTSNIKQRKNGMCKERKSLWVSCYSTINTNNKEKQMMKKKEFCGLQIHSYLCIKTRRKKKQKKLFETTQLSHCYQSFVKYHRYTQIYNVQWTLILNTKNIYSVFRSFIQWWWNEIKCNEIVRVR